MNRPTRGLVIGKFLPPHLGHKYLIDFAASFVDELTVLVCTLQKQPIPGPLRFEWIRRSFGGVRVLHHPDENPEEPSDAETPEQFWALWRASILSYLDAPPDYVFASEPYGAKLAEVLGARFIPGDLPRELVPISGTALRGHLGIHWEYLLPAARPYFARRIAVIGSESSGKSTLTQFLAAHFGTKYAAEYARAYLDSVSPDITAEALLTIVQGHRASEDALAEQCSDLLFCDTEAITTKLYAQIFLHFVPPEIERYAAEDRYALYLVTTATEDWVPAPQRYQPEYAARASSAMRVFWNWSVLEAVLLSWKEAGSSGRRKPWRQWRLLWRRNDRLTGLNPRASKGNSPPSRAEEPAAEAFPRPRRRELAF